MIHESVKIFPGAKVIENVEIGKLSSIWFNAVVRGDIEPITIGKYSNIQDNCVVHTSKDYPVEIGDYVSVGHAAILHGCSVGDNCLIGINSTVLNGAKIRKNSIVGAGAVVTEGKKFSEGSLILGVPAKAVRQLQEEEIGNMKNNAIRYMELAKSEK
ncbi:MAG: gamma carbonic anhydrase family protein [Euryarchaeota archaeon]|nr:gamma carbonic anhydrase family protein [Euryarchaeota archaeon]